MHEIPPPRLVRCLLAVLVPVLASGAVAYYEESLPSTLNPLFRRTQVDERAHELIFDRLFLRDPRTGEAGSRIVEGVGWLEGGTGLRLTLKSGITWHDGAPLTVQDVCFTVDALLDERTPSAVAVAYREWIAGCSVSGDEATITFRRTLPEPLLRLGFYVLPRHKFASTVVEPEDRFGAEPTGTGPYQAKWTSHGVEFTAYPAAHRRAAIPALSLAEGGDPRVQVKTLWANGVQGIVRVPPDLQPELVAMPDVVLKRYDQRAWWYVALNTHRGPLQDPRVRQALDLLLDRTELRDATVGPDAPCELMSGPFLPGSPWADPSIRPAARSNRDEAFRLLREAGGRLEVGQWSFAGVPLTLRIGMLAPLDREAPDLLEQLRGQFRRAGFDTAVWSISADAWGTKILRPGGAEDYDLLVGKWSVPAEEDVTDYFHTARGTLGRRNIFGYSNREVDALLGRYRDAGSGSEAQEATRALHALLARDRPYLFLWKLDAVSAWRTELRGVEIAPYHYFTNVESWRE